MKTQTKNWILIALIWSIILTSVLYMVAMNGKRTQLILNAQAGYTEDYGSEINNFHFGDKLRESQLDMEMVYNRIEAVRRCEGWYKEGSLAQRNNNQGNYKAGGVTDSQGHTIFDTPLQSYQFMLKYFMDRQGQTMYQISRYYASASDQWYYCVTHSL